MSQRWRLARFLASDEAASVLDVLSREKIGPPTLLRLRRRWDRPEAELLYEVALARVRAHEKFHWGERIWATRRGLEQSTGEVVARWKANRFAGCSHVADLCCGIGGDTLALAKQVSNVLAVDQDPVMASMARQNAAVADVLMPAVCVARCQDLRIDAGTAWHLDPDRRTGGKRTVDPERMEPPRAWIAELLERAPTGAIKLAPATRIDGGWPASAEWTWISHGGECRQLVGWFGDLAVAPGGRRAVKLEDDGTAVEWLGEDNGEPVPMTTHVGSLLLELDAALLASNLAGDFLTRLGLQALTSRGGYATSEELPEECRPWMRSYEVETVLPLRFEAVMRWLRASDCRVTQVKQRGAGIAPETWLRRLVREQPEGKDRVLVATVLGKRRVAILARGGPNDI